MRHMHHSLFARHRRVRRPASLVHLDHLLRWALWLLIWVLLWLSLLIWVHCTCPFYYVILYMCICARCLSVGQSFIILTWRGPHAASVSILLARILIASTFLRL